MRTIESVVSELYAKQHMMDSLCGYDEGQPIGLIYPSQEWRDSPLRCSLSAVWHIKAGTPPHHMMLQSCDRHFAMCVKLVRVYGLEPSIHEYVGACGLPSTFWLDDHNTCATQEAMWDIGLLQKVESAIESEEDQGRCRCNCPTCATWIHLTTECDLAIDAIGYAHNHYIRLTMEEQAN